MNKNILHSSLSRNSHIFIAVVLICLFPLSLAQSPHILFTKESLEITTVKCMIQNCLQCQQNLPYTCKTCQQDKTCCSPFCKNCMPANPTVCLQCQENYVFNSTSKTCIQKNSCSQSYCSDCKRPPQECQGCNLGFFINPFTLTCTPCPKGCSSCNITLDCQYCDNHWYFKNQVCEKCDPICQKCQNIPTRCISCPSKKYLQNFTCFSCLEHCQNCTGPAQCDTCDIQHYFDNNTKTCELCGQYCDTCNSVTECIRCQQSYFLNYTTKFCQTCDQCIPNCAMCIDRRLDSQSSNDHTSQIVSSENPNVRCLKCNPGFLQFNNQECKPCITHCITCLTLTECTTCEKGYVYYSETKKCITCNIAHCIVCKTLTECSICEQGFFWNNISHPEFSYCERCQTGCIYCGVNYCKTCDGGYYFVNNTCLKCNSECLLCEDKPDKCIACGFGYFMAESSLKCVKCAENCLRCNTRDVCVDCTLGYRNQNKTCIKCTIQNCGFCIKNQTSAETCLECLEKYILKNNACVPCIQGCLACPVDNKCIQCSKGYYFEHETSTCTKCQQNCVDCQVVDGWHVDCLRCITGYFADQKNHCQPCAIANCSACTELTCIRCISGFYLNLDRNNCDLCPKNCTQCVDKETCVSCVQGFYLKDFKCVKCSNGCEICNNQGNCIVCLNGFRLDEASNTCQACKTANCAQCQGNANFCTQCYPSFTLENKSQQKSLETEENSSSLCFKCGQNLLSGCKSCLSSTICYECINGYRLTENNLCDAQRYEIWPYILVISILAGIILLFTGNGFNNLGLKLKRKMEEGKSLKEILKIDNKSTSSEDYHKLEQLSIN